MSSVFSAINKFVRFYYDGFRGMSSWGKKAWLVIIIKLFIMFAVLKLFFFPDLLKKNFANDTERSEHVRNELINPRQ